MADVALGPVSQVLVFLCSHLCNCPLRCTIHPSRDSSAGAFPHLASEEQRQGLPQGCPSPLGIPQTTATWGSAQALFPRPTSQLDPSPAPLFWGRVVESKAWEGENLWFC